MNEGYTGPKCWVKDQNAEMSALEEEGDELDAEYK